MPSNQTDNLKAVIDQFTPEVLGVFWITDEELSLDLHGFDEFNYLFDGLISQYLYGQKSTGEKQLPRANIFFTNNFDKKLFLAHIKHEGDISGILDDQVALIQENSKERRKVLIFNKTSKNWMVELKKRYSQFEFFSLDF